MAADTEAGGCMAVPGTASCPFRVVGTLAVATNPGSTPAEVGVAVGRGLLDLAAATTAAAGGPGG